MPPEAQSQTQEADRPGKGDRLEFVSVTANQNPTGTSGVTTENNRNDEQRFSR